MVPLYALDSLLDEFIVTQKDASGATLPSEQQYRTAVKKAILDEVSTVFDVEGEAWEITERVELKDGDNKTLAEYVRVKPARELYSTYTVASTGTTVKVEGVSLSGR